MAAFILLFLMLATLNLAQLQEDVVPVSFFAGDDDFVQRLRDSPYNARAVPRKEQLRSFKPRMPLLRY